MAQTREERNAYMRDYMRAKRPSRSKRVERAAEDREPQGTGPRSTGEMGYAAKTADAAYLPKRDAALQWESPSAELLGDPPIGRRAIDQRR